MDNEDPRARPAALSPGRVGGGLDVRLVPRPPVPAAGRSLLLLIRHAESVANAERRFTHHDDEPLTPLGERQAEAAGLALATAFEVTALYASPFLRTVQTARGLGRPWRLEPSLDERLREQSFGELAGRPYESYYPVVSGLGTEERWHHAAPGGESLVEVAERVTPALLDIGARHPGETVLVAVHGGVLAALRGALSKVWSGPPVATANVRGYGVLVAGAEEALDGPLQLFAEEGG